VKISQAGIDLIKEFEGCELTAYVCPAGVLTVGYGHTGPDVKPGQEIDEDEAEQLLRNDLAKFETCVEEMLEVEVTQAQFDALVSFAFNLGCGALRSSTLLKLLNGGKPDAARQQFSRWNKGCGQVITGLTRRRAAEAAMFG
jgi:lysozyme